ncbi:XRE family transcriptional regulator [Butyrivibrio sp. X503]|uniref:helix-turn-helix domain-containing protein n=1 Tax=Butyrivibrio sp. X503 TaxID=2364878 RepID=UPI000EA85AA7|nr:helix-turn-helix transcriptional regulator [Butyrivibrio sp. X503]RKM53787.1 XRE family transcriptional regulator [Butyrivibrio sp. X503]
MTIEDAVRQRIIGLCKENDITINALATKAGMPRTTLKNIIYGTSRNTGIVTIKLVCDALGISINDFFDNELFKDLEPVKD